MFIINMIRGLLALPLEWIGSFLHIIRSPISTPLLLASYRIGKDRSVAHRAICSSYLHKGPQPTLAIAEHWLKHAPCPEALAWAGELAFEAGDHQKAVEYFQAGETAGDDLYGIRQTLEYNLAATEPDRKLSEQLIAKLAQRRDLSEIVTRPLACWQINYDLMAGNFQKVEANSKRILQIDDSIAPLVALYVVNAVKPGREQNAEKYLKTADNLLKQRQEAAANLSQQSHLNKAMRALNEMTTKEYYLCRSYAAAILKQNDLLKTFLQKLEEFDTKAANAVREEIAESAHAGSLQ